MRYLLLAAVSLSIAPSMLSSQTRPVTPAPIAPDAIGVARRDALERARVQSSAAIVRAPSEARVRLLPRTWSYVNTRVDSVNGATLFVRQPLGLPSGAIATVAIPVVRGEFKTPDFSVNYLFSRPNFGALQGLDVVPRAELERVALHAKMREFIELGALFEPSPANAASGTRAVHAVRYEDGSGDIRLAIDARRTSTAVRDTIILGRSAVAVRDSTELELTHAYLRASRLTAVVGKTRETLRGNIVGTRYIDKQTQIVFAMDDTVHMTGSTVISDGYGGTIESPLVL